MGYLSEQVARGRLGRTEPLVALQLLAGPMVTYALSSPLSARLGLTIAQEQFVGDLLDLWLQAIAR
ncbi:MAG TPA: hypothetical protein VFA49_13700 [Chloroflexota bacterium]|nr:hypothetical protein [Chloroflexota bacterium]